MKKKLLTDIHTTLLIEYAKAYPYAKIARNHAKVIISYELVRYNLLEIVNDPFLEEFPKFKANARTFAYFVEVFELKPKSDDWRHLS